MGRFFTPQQVTPINLDLAQLEGGSSFPSQYEGETHDGRDVYARYRGGWLEVYVASTPEDEAYTSKNAVIDAHIGPPYHGRISRSTLCALAGITVNGSVPSSDLDDEDEEPEVDFSGSTSFYDFQIDTTQKTEKALVEAVLRLPNLQVLVRPPTGKKDPEPNDLLCHCYEDVGTFAVAVFGDSLDLGRLVDWTSGRPLNHVYPEHTFVRFYLAGPRETGLKWSDGPQKQLSDFMGYPIELKANSDIHLFDALNVISRFDTADDQCRQYLEELDALINQFYPIYRYNWFDLKTREPLPRVKELVACDPEFVAWVEAQDNRWHTARFEGWNETRRAIGARLTRE